MRVIAVDPGVTTGIVVAEVERGAVTDVLWFGQLACNRDVAWWLEERRVAKTVGKLFMRWGCTQIVMEDFLIRAGVDAVSNRDLLSPCRVGLAIVTALPKRFVARCAWQSPSDMSVMTDDRMKKLDLFQPGLPHVNDAMRHMVIFARRQVIGTNQAQVIGSGA